MLSLQGVEVSVVDLERSLTEQLLDPIDKDLWKAGELSGVAEWAAHDGVVPLRPGPLSISVDLIVGPHRRVGATDVPEVDAALARRLERRPTTLTLLTLGTVCHAARHHRVLESCERIVLLTSKSLASIRVVRQVGRSLLTLTTADWCYATIDTPTIGSYPDDATYAAPRLVAAFRASLTAASGTEVERPEGDPRCVGVVLYRVPRRDKSTPVFLPRPAAAGHGLTNHGIRPARREFTTVASRLARWSGIDWPSSGDHPQQGSSASRPDRVPRFCTTAAAEREAQMGLQSGYLTDPEDDAGVGRYLRHERLEDVLDSEHSLIVIGEPGIGKSHEYSETPRASGGASRALRARRPREGSVPSTRDIRSPADHLRWPRRVHR